MRAQVRILIVVALLAVTLIVLRQLFPRLFEEELDVTTVGLAVFLLPILVNLVLHSFRQNQRPNHSQKLPGGPSPVREQSARRAVAKTMSPQPERPTILQSVPSELQAAILVFQLNNAGLDAWTEGGIASGFRAEAPGNANVVVRFHDLRRAHSVLRKSLHPGPSTSASTSPAQFPKPSSRRIIWIVVAWLMLILILLA